jgi:hypothetical protein
MDQNRKFAEMNGLLDECDCGNSLCRYPISDFSDPREVLKVVMEREQGYWHDFSRSLWVKVFSTVTANHLDHFYQIEIMIEKSVPIDYITTPGKLRDAWIEWREKQE